MTYLRFALVCALLTFIGVQFSGQHVLAQSKKLVPISPDKKNMAGKWESFTETIPVSGDVRVGVMATENTEKVIPTAFYVKIPNEGAKVLCADISSGDGRYSAHLTYDIRKFRGDNFPFELPTQYQRELANYAVKNIAILAQIGENCNDPKAHYVLAAWNTREFSSASVKVYLNSKEQTDIVFTMKDNKPPVTVKCEKILENSATAYTSRCTFPGNLVTEASEINIRRIIRIGSRTSYGFHDLPISF